MIIKIKLKHFLKTEIIVNPVIFQITGSCLYIPRDVLPELCL